MYNLGEHLQTFSLHRQQTHTHKSAATLSLSLPTLTLTVQQFFSDINKHTTHERFA